MPPTSFMTPQLKKDINTIFEVLAFGIIWMGLAAFYSNLPGWVAVVLIAIGVGHSIYTRYRKITNADIILFPTLNDESARTGFITFGILILIFAALVYFVFNIKLLLAGIGIVAGTAFILFGRFDLPKGWLSVENNNLKLYGVSENIDTRQLKEIMLKNDEIRLTNIYGENKYSRLLKLTPVISERIKLFLEEKLHNGEITVIDNVINPD